MRARGLLLFLLLALAVLSARGDTNISGNITTDTTWTVAGSPYILSGDVSVGSSAGATLTIEAGVVVKCNTNAHFLINHTAKGALVANGTAANPIVLTANNSTSAGAWFGLRFGSVAGAPASSLSYVTVEYAGSNQHLLGGITVVGLTPSLDHVTSRNHQYAGIKIEGGAPSITSSTIRDNAGLGIYMTGGDATLTDVALLSNSGVALSAHVMAQLSGMTGISATGNGTDRIEYRAGDITASRTWKTSAVPYLVTGSIHVKGAGSPILTIEAGNTIRFAGSSQIAVNYQNKGGLAANGTASAPILFTSNAASPTAGSWWGLYFGEVAGAPASTLSYSTIEYGGLAGAQRGGVTIHNVTPSFDHVTIRNSAYAGAALHGAGASFTDCTISGNSGPGIRGLNPVTLTLASTAFTDNDGYAVTAHASTTFVSTSGLTASGNTQGRNAIEIRGGDIAANRTWTTSAIPYVVNGGILVRGGSAPILTIEAGNTIRFGSASQIAVNYQNKGGLSANGTASAPILFTSNAATPVAGSWYGLYFGEFSGNTPSSVSHATIEYGGLPGAERGGVTIYSVIPVFTNVIIRNSAYAGASLHGAGMTMSGSTITASSGPGIRGLNAATLHLTDTAFTDNAGYAVTVAANTTFANLSGLTASGNGTGRDGIELRQGVIVSDKTWPLSALPYVVSGNLDVQGASAPVLTIEAGNTIKFNASAQLAVNHSAKGGLRANGTAAAPIVFTSNTNAAQGAWLGLWFGPTAAAPQSNLTYATVEYGGSTYWSRGGVTVNVAAPLFDHVTVRNNQFAGMIVNGGAPVVRDSTFTANGGAGINVANAAATGLALTDDTFTNNGGYAVTMPASVPLTEGSGLAASGNGTGRDAVELRAAVIAVNRTWLDPGLPYVVTGFVDVYGAAAPILTIGAGTTIRFNAGAQITINHSGPGAMQAHGTAAAPIVFTSNGAQTPGHWIGLWFGPIASPPPSSITYAVIEYGGVAGGYRGGITVNAGSPVFDHVTLRQNVYAGLAVNNGSSARITNSHFHDNPAGLLTRDQSTAVAKLNYWNNAAGPCFAGGCASGQQSVSTAVQYEPWLVSTPTQPQFVTDSVQKNRVFSPAIGAVTTVDYTTALTGDAAVTIRNAASTVVRAFVTSGTAGQFVWDGKNDSGAVQPDGSYSYEIASTAPSQPPAAIARGMAVIDSTRALTLSNPAVNWSFFSPNADSVQDAVTVTTATNYDDATWTVSVRDAASNVVRTQNGTGPAIAYTWDGKDAGGVVQPDGVYTLRVDVAEGTAALQKSASSTLDVTLPVVSIATPLANAVLSNVYTNGSTLVVPTGSVNDANLRNWTFDLGEGAAPSSWYLMGSGNTAFTDGNLCSWPSANNPNGTYSMRLLAWDKAGNFSIVHRSPLTLGNYKTTMNTYQFNASSGGTVTYTSTVPFELTHTVVVKNEGGTVVRNLVPGVARAAGVYNDAFNGRDDANVLLPDGPYFYVATVTDGTHTLSWDLSNDFRNDYGSWNDNLNIQAYDPFDNKPMTFNYNFAQPGRVSIATSTSPGSVIGNCLQPSATFFCPVIERWEPSGPQSFSWSGLDHTGAFRTIRSAAIVIGTSKWPKNAALMYGTKGKVTNVKVTPRVFGPAAGTQTIEFDLATHQSQPANVSIALVNLSTLSTLRTLTLTNQAAGHVTTTWNGRADNDMWVAPGRYAVVVSATDAQGNAVRGEILTQIQY